MSSPVRQGRYVPSVNYAVRPSKVVNQTARTPNFYSSVPWKRHRMRERNGLGIPSACGRDIRDEHAPVIDVTNLVVRHWLPARHFRVQSEFEGFPLRPSMSRL